MAASLRPTCGSERGAPGCNTQRLFAEEPQVGHGTAEICLGVSSLFLIYTKCDTPTRKSVENCAPPRKKASLNLGTRTLRLVRSGGLIGSQSVHSQKGSARGAQQINTGFTVFQRHACVGYAGWPSWPGSQSEVGCRLPELSCELHSLGSREGTQAQSMANLCTFSQAEVWKQS
jgi:hypothetical protein